MSTKVDELKLDIEEIKNFIQQASRPRTKDILGLEVRRLQTELSKLIQKTNSTSTTSTDVTSRSAPKCYQVKLNNYGWDQTNAAVKLYVTLNDVHLLPKEAVTCNFSDKSVDLRVFGLDNKNYNLTINNLCEEIDVNKSSVKVKTDMVLVSLVKKIPKMWSHMTEVEKRNKESKASSIMDATGSETDPSAGIMNLMKKLYQEGDDKLKAAIAEAWTESQEKMASSF
ncbi:calcyclin-binding protein-like [Hylaeus volcanicus]|uniref:calcyclin-binding protein-like n=1 Tax=Hylaeus volcanicus TaxID=313075 RepID=UPI0023B8322D|nr:calcyclin-binding protein-like [Hylaeus volcanicus]